MRARSRLAPLVAAFALACAYEGRHPIQWDSRIQIWQAGASQVKVRAAQSRVFDSVDRRRALEAAVVAFQDLDFQVEVLDEELGIVSGKKFVDLEGPAPDFEPAYFLYDEADLVVFTRAFRTWGPFWHRSNLVRLTVTIRERNASQLIVRAAAQFHLRPIEEPEPYQEFFRTLEQAIFTDRALGAGG